jgi:hypothetical protein
MRTTISTASVVFGRHRNAKFPPGNKTLLGPVFLQIKVRKKVFFKIIFIYSTKTITRIFYNYFTGI